MPIVSGVSSMSAAVACRHTKHDESSRICRFLHVPLSSSFHGLSSELLRFWFYLQRCSTHWDGSCIHSKPQTLKTNTDRLRHEDLYVDSHISDSVFCTDIQTCTFLHDGLQRSGSVEKTDQDSRQVTDKRGPGEAEDRLTNETLSPGGRFNS